LKFLESKNNVQECLNGCSFFFPIMKPSDDAVEVVDVDESDESSCGVTSSGTCALSAGFGFPSLDNLSTGFSDLGDSEMLFRLEPIRSRMADNDGTSLYPLIYPSRLGPRDMLSPPVLGAIGDVNGSVVGEAAPSLALSLLAPASIGTEDPVECERNMALAGSFSRPEGEAVYGEAVDAGRALVLMATLSFGGVLILSGRSWLTGGSMLTEDGDWVARGDGR
jgi:hypothetical protein